MASNNKLRQVTEWQVRQTRLEINLRNLDKNFKILKTRAGKNTKLLVLMKCDAYGHSSVAIARHLDRMYPKKGLFGFGVANVEEGVLLRREHIQAPIYVLSGIQAVNEELLRCLLTCQLVPIVTSLESLKALAKETKKQKQTLKLQIKFNTGMNRLGINESDAPAVIRLLAKNQQLQLEGILSHYSCAEKPNSSLTKQQNKAFARILDLFEQKNVQLKYIHMENSAGLAHHCFPEGNIARVGLHLFGVGDSKLHAVARWTAEIYQIREVKKGEAIGYGPIFKAPKKMRIAILAVGYGDGYSRAFSNKADVLINGKRCRVVGAISMDLTAVDITNVADVRSNSRAILLGKDRKQCVSAVELAHRANCIPWEILTSISVRVPRVIVG